MPDNQTKDEWLELPVVATDTSAQGTGVYLAQAGNPKAYEVNVTYDAMLAKAKRDNFYAFAWVPHAVATVAQIQQEPCGGRCSKTCKRPGCLCDLSAGRCK
jgi:hypothetical protein